MKAEARVAARVATRGLLVGCLCLTAACAPSATGQDRTPTRVIVFIADGAGPAHWTLAAYAKDDLAVGRMKTVGLVDTRGSNHIVSGSAPTATAYATGVRTFMGAIGVGPDSLPVRNVVEAAIDRGLATGIMTTTLIVDATPAAFSTHVPARSQFRDIARQMVDKDLTVLIGGGRSAFEPPVQPESADLLGRLRAEHTYVESVEELSSLDPDTVTSLVGLLAEGEMGTVAERGQALQTMTATALAVLDHDPDGFFLMIENEESDTQAHQNQDRQTITTEMLDMDAAVGQALAYQARHPETLVIVTGDHETGGISLPYDRSPDRKIVMQYASGGHTGVMVPLFASGPGAERFGGIIRNDRVGQILMEIVGG